MSNQPNGRFSIIPVASELNNLPVENIVGEYLTHLKSIGGIIEREDYGKSGLPLFVFVITGGTEQRVLDLRQNKRDALNPVYLIAHPGNNSLPASLEILAKLQQENVKGRIFYLNSATKESPFEQIENAVKHIEVRNEMRKSRIGLIGPSSEWLVASMPDHEILERKWGPAIVPLQMSELIDLTQDVSDEEIEIPLKSFTAGAREIIEPSKKEIKNAVKVYSALKKMAWKHDLNAVAVRCFDLLTGLKTTGCYALAKLNDEGIVAGCEGDLVSTLGMFWVNRMTGSNVWMANPAQADIETNSIWLAHCTVPVNMIGSYKLRSHFESGIGVGIEGEFEKGKVTLLRIGGKELEKIWISEGEIMESGRAENLCRTQVHVHLSKEPGVSEFLDAPLGNHVILFRGKYKKHLQSWWETFIDN
jgi:L-fucose isomerase-like protein